MNRGVWQPRVHGIAKNQTQLSNLAHAHRLYFMSKQMTILESRRMFFIKVWRLKMLPEDFIFLEVFIQPWENF